MKDLYAKITDTLTNTAAINLFQSKGLSTVKFVDVWKGQYLSPERFELNLSPAIFFEWSIEHPLNTGSNDSLATIIIHIAYEQKRDTSSLSQAKTEALKYFDFIETVHELLAELEAEKTGKLVLINEATIQQDVIETAYILTYQCPYTGKASCPEWDYTGEDGDVDINGTLVEKL